MRMPLPLGGSSNHFRTAVLREVGGWDAWNVTEDADLGFRLARFGYRSVTFDSTTDEEAPIRFKAWLGQRSRWMKGWMQTWGVHMREPRRLWREAGPRGFPDAQYHRRRQRADRARLPDSCCRTCGVSPRPRPPAARPAGSSPVRWRPCTSRRSRPALLSTVADRPDGARPARPSSQRLGSGADADLLGLPVDRRVACAVAALARSLSLGKDRARPHARAGHQPRRRARRRLRIR